MNLFDDDTDSEQVNVLDYLEFMGIGREQAFHIILHLLLTRTAVFPEDIREAAAEINIYIPIVHPGDGRMH